MKTTVDLPDSLLDRARKVAAREGTSIRALIEESLQRVLADHEKGAPFSLRHVTFGGQGLHPDLRGRAWSDILDTSYGERSS